MPPAPASGKISYLVPECWQLDFRALWAFPVFLQVLVHCQTLAYPHRIDYFDSIKREPRAGVLTEEIPV